MPTHRPFISIPSSLMRLALLIVVSVALPGACLYALGYWCSYYVPVMILWAYMLSLASFFYWKLEYWYWFVAPATAWGYYTFGQTKYLGRVLLIWRERNFEGRRVQWSVHQTSFPFLIHGPTFGLKTMISTMYANVLDLATDLKNGGLPEVESVRIPLYLFPKTNVDTFAGKTVPSQDGRWFLRICPNEVRARARIFGVMDPRGLIFDPSARSLVMTRAELIANIPLLAAKVRLYSSAHPPLSR